ncbi:hypothetical protein L2E82_09119 [Cichorium intybus]|uniref:Uncharacterized protein n=1 Tax=Cichorium intybus TaxID=13427 RepID=A0ACB9G7K0_CICIN|nr:hypothetical protein L2E82_09119 [Cichorium intybus]
MDPISESVLVTCGTILGKVRVTEVDGILFQPYSKAAEHKIPGTLNDDEVKIDDDSEEGDSVEVDDVQSSDEEQFMSSEDGTQAGFSDEEDEDFEVTDDEESVVHDTFFEETVKGLSTHEGENEYKMGPFYEFKDAKASGDHFTPKKLVEKDLDKEIRPVPCTSGGPNMSDFQNSSSNARALFGV